MSLSRSPSPATRGPSSLNIARVRPRTNKDELLPQDFDHASSIYTPSPSTLRQLTKHIRRTDYSQALRIFKKELKDTLLTTNPDEKKLVVIAVRVYKRLTEQNAFLWAQRVSYNLEFEINLLQLREFQYFARYGDYTRIISTRLRQHACEMKTSDWELLSGKYYWSDIASNLKNEDENLKNIRFNDCTVREAADYRTHAVVCNASRSLAISEDVALWSIIEYGLRNEKVHRDLEALRAEGEFQQLTTLVYQHSGWVINGNYPLH